MERNNVFVVIVVLFIASWLALMIGLGIGFAKEAEYGEEKLTHTFREGYLEGYSDAQANRAYTPNKEEE